MDQAYISTSDPVNPEKVDGAAVAEGAPYLANPLPRFLKLSPDIETAMINYISTELDNHKAERDGWIDDLIRIQSDYWATPSEEVKTFPFVGAAKLIIPLTAIAFEAVHARTMTTMFGLKQQVSVKAKSDKWADLAGPYERFLDTSLRASRFRDSIEPSIIELEKLGTGVGRVEYEHCIKYGIMTLPDGTESEFPVVSSKGAKIFSVPLSRYLQPFNSTDPQTAAWCGEIHVVNQHQLYLMEMSGQIEPGTYARINKWCSPVSASGDDDYTEAQEEREKRSTIWANKITLFSLWMAYDVDRSGRMKELHVVFHKDTNSLCGIRYNDKKDLRRPYRKGVYFPIEHRWTGIGIGKQNEQFQEEVTTQHRQRIDNATIANMRMFKISRMSGYGNKEPIFPGKQWFVDDMTHIDSIQLGEIYPSAYNNENQTVLYSQQRTGVNEVTLGMPQVGTPGTATGDLARVQEGRKKFDYVYGNIKSYANDLVGDFAATLHQYGPKRVEFFDDSQAGQAVKQILELPEELVTEGLIFEISVAGEQDNKLINRQNWTQIAGMLVQYYDGLLKLSTQLGDQQLAQAVAKKAMQGASEAMKQILESYDVRNIERIVMTELINNPRETLNAISQPRASGFDGGGGEIATNPSSLSAMDGSSQLITPSAGQLNPELTQLFAANGGLRA